MTWPVVLAVLLAAALHASWNALVKSGGDKSLDTALQPLVGACFAVPLLALVGLPPVAAWPFILASMAIHIGYYFSLAGAYRHGELGLTYPVMRGSAPLLVALASGLVLGEAPRPLAWLGIGGITAGVLLVGLSHPGQTLHRRKALAYALANALIIALYTLVDAQGVRIAVAAGHGAVSYVLLLFVLNGVPYASLVWLRRDAAGRREMLAYARRRWQLAALGGAAAVAAYGIALWAMTQAPVASVAALRETSVLFAALLATVLLKERFGLQRALGTVVIVGGVVALRLA